MFSYHYIQIYIVPHNQDFLCLKLMGQVKAHGSLLNKPHPPHLACVCSPVGMCAMTGMISDWNTAVNNYKRLEKISCK